MSAAGHCGIASIRIWSKIGEPGHSVWVSAVPIVLETALQWFSCLVVVTLYQARGCAAHYRPGERIWFSMLRFVPLLPGNPRLPNPVTAFLTPHRRNLPLHRTRRWGVTQLTSCSYGRSEPSLSSQVASPPRSLTWCVRVWQGAAFMPALRTTPSDPPPSDPDSHARAEKAAGPAGGRF